VLRADRARILLRILRAPAHRLRRRHNRAKQKRSPRIPRFVDDKESGSRLPENDASVFHRTWEDKTTRKDSFRRALVSRPTLEFPNLRPHWAKEIEPGAKRESSARVTQEKPSQADPFPEPTPAAGSSQANFDPTTFYSGRLGKRSQRLK